MRLDPRGGIPLYIQLSRRLRSDIEAGRLSDGELIPSEHQLSEQFFVSRHTVRQALADLERSGFVERLRGRGTFVRIGRGGNRGGKQGAKDVNAGLIGLVVPYVTDHFLSDVIRGVEQAATASGFELVFRSSRADARREAEVIAELAGVGLSGLLIFPTDEVVVLPGLDALLLNGIPCVTMDRRLQRSDVSYVISDNQKGAAEAVMHLIDHGHERIAFAAGSPLSVHTVWDRFAGYREAFERKGLSYDSSLYVFVPQISRMDEKSAHEAYRGLATTLLDLGVTAVFAVNDLVALDVIAACRTMGVHVPEEMAVIGFDDIDIADRIDVPLTTVAQQKEEIGRRATALLLELIGSGAGASKGVVLETHLVIRKSCGTRREHRPSDAVTPRRVGRPG